MKKLYIISISVGLPIIVIVAILISSIFFKNVGYDTPKDCFFSIEKISHIDFTRKLTKMYRKFIADSEIAVLPMDDYMVYYIGYVHDSKDNEKNVALLPMKIEEGKYHLLDAVKFVKDEDFARDTTFSLFHGAYNLSYTIIPADSPEIQNYDPNIYSFVNAKYIDSDGVKQDVFFCYTYGIFWEPGDGSFCDKFSW